MKFSTGRWGERGGQVFGWEEGGNRFSRGEGEERGGRGVRLPGGVGGGEGSGFQGCMGFSVVKQVFQW